MRIFYDTEFIEDGRTVDLISIGMVAEDGREYYAVSQAASRRPLRRRIRRHDWLMANVVPSLPKAHGDWNLHMPRRWLFNYCDPAVKPRQVIGREVRDFIRASPDPQLWAWYGAYDHVALCQLWGPMIGLPEGVPMWTNDLRQECVRLGNPQMPAQKSGEHNALADARHVKIMAEFLMS
jgi:hypothetical protein